MKTFNWMITIILIFCLISVYSNTNLTENTEISNMSISGNPETSQAVVFSVSDSSGPVIGIPTLDDPTPDSDEDVDVTVPIQDIDGIQNTTLFWQYTSLNTTWFNNSAPSSSTVPVVEVYDEEFDVIGVTGDITQTGVITPTPTNWRYGEYTYNASMVSEIDLSIIASGPTALVYVVINAKFNMTGEWETVYENGGIGLDESFDLGKETYQNTTPTLGYNIFAVTYRDSIPDVSDPKFDPLIISRNESDWTIPAANDDTYVDYHIEAYDNLNQSTISPTYTFLMDFTPSFYYEIPPPPTIRGDEDIIFTVQVEDRDGYDTINKSSGIVYYWLSDPSETIEIALIHDLEDPYGGSYGYQYFNGTIPAGNIQNNETSLYFRVNVSDIVDETRGREGSSSEQQVWVDSLNPRVTGITIDGGVSIPGKNVTLVDVSVNITVNLFDWSSISSVAIYYSMLNGTTLTKLIMQNTTDLGQSTETFNVTLPSANETAFVEYFFETNDSLGNKGNISFINSYYSDGMGPALDILSTYPLIVSNYTNVLVLFNSSDYSGSMQSVLWYSLDNQTSWVPIGASDITNQNVIDHQETFKATDLHYIEDNTVSSFPLEIIRTGPVDTAILTFEITHEMPSDLRIWLKLDDGREFMLFDREPGPNDIKREIEITRLGITEADFTKGNFTLVIQDFSELFSGTITKYEIELVHYSIPLGYQYMATIPASINDTTVYYYLTMTDNLWNSENTSIFQYYSDGLVPSISVVAITSPMNLAGGHFIRVSADIIDQGGVLGADTYYKFSESDDWAVGSMILNSTTGVYFFDVPIPTENGTLYYKVRAFDFSGLSSETTIYSVSYSHGLAPFIEVQGYPYPSPLDMNGTNTIRIWANVTDIDGMVTDCTIGYRFEDTDDWHNEDMILDEETGYYYFDVKVNRKSGNLTFIIYATDNLNLTSESDPHIIEFENAGTTPGLPPELLPLVAVLALGGGSIAAVVYLSKKGKLKLPERFSRD